MFKRINKPLTKNGKELFAIGDTCNEIIGDSANWEKVKKSIWDLEHGDIFWYISSNDAMVYKGTWNENSDWYQNLREAGLIYLTEQSAKEDKWRKTFETKMRKEFKPEECDWNNSEIRKYYITYDTYNKCIDFDFTWFTKTQNITHCNDGEIVEQFIKDNESDLLRYFGVVK